MALFPNLTLKNTFVTTRIVNPWLIAESNQPKKLPRWLKLLLWVGF